MKIEIGMQYIPRSDKKKRIHTVIDCYKTYNSKNELVNTKYVATYDFIGQTMTVYDVVQPTIAIGAL